MSFAKFKSIDNEPKEFRAVPPELPFVVHVPQNKLVVNDKTDPTNIINGEYIANSSGAKFSRWKTWLTPIRIFNRKDSYFHGAIGWGNGYKQGPYKWTGRGNEQYIGGGTPETYFTTTAVTGEVIAGEWIEIKLPYKLKLSKYVIQSYRWWPKRYSPWKFTMLGSEDGINWVILDRQDVDPDNAYDSTKTGNFKISKDIPSYNTFRIVIENAGAYVNLFSGIELYGLKPPKPCMNLTGPCENFQSYNNSMSIIEGTTNMTTPETPSVMSETPSVMSANNKLLADLNDFNQKYSIYVGCQNETSNCDSNITKDNVIDAKDLVISDITQVTTAIGNLTQGKSIDEYDASHNEIINTHRDIMKLRSELDMKLKEIYVTEDSIAYQQKQMFDGTAYTSLVWTVLATSTLYYVFKHL